MEAEREANAAHARDLERQAGVRRARRRRQRQRRDAVEAGRVFHDL